MRQHHGHSSLAFKSLPSLLGGMVLLFALLQPNMLFSQERVVTRQHQQWLQTYHQLDWNERWGASLELGYRWGNFFDFRTQHMSRAAAIFRINPQIVLATGAGWMGAYANGELCKVEFRPHQQLTIKHSLAKISLKHRYRVEQQFFNPVEQGEICGPGSFNWRFRYAFSASVPLIYLSKKHPERLLSLNLGNEIQIKTGPDIYHSLFDKNRILISTNLRLTKTTSIALTWNNQFSSSSTPGHYNSTQVIWFHLRQKLDLRKGQ